MATPLVIMAIGGRPVKAQGATRRRDPLIVVEPTLTSSNDNQTTCGLTGGMQGVARLETSASASR